MPARPVSNAARTLGAIYGPSSTFDSSRKFSGNRFKAVLLQPCLNEEADFDAQRSISRIVYRIDKYACHSQFVMLLTEKSIANFAICSMFLALT